MNSSIAVMTDADLSLARAVLSSDARGVRAAVDAGATAHQSPFMGISWAFVPLLSSLREAGSVTDAAKLCMRSVIDAGAPVKGVAQVVGSGVRFSKDDLNYFLDNWLWRDAEEIGELAKRVFGQDELLCALVETGHVSAETQLYGGKSYLAVACELGHYRSVRAMGLQGGDVNATSPQSSPDGQPMTLLEAAVTKGDAMVANALISCGAFFSEDRLLALASVHGEGFSELIKDCARSFERGTAIDAQDLLARLPGAGVGFNKPKVGG